ncbi:MAG: 4-oxalocrotonate tautomerase [bacterium]|nr:4-oxalocrotonate tautomerase [bacterium]
MPIISITMGQQADDQQKSELIQKLTSTAVEITKMPEYAFTVLIHELPDQNIGLGGKTLTEVKKSQ